MKDTEKTIKDSGVSPVIGVMLMLVVTIVIAAFVAAFAGGMFSSSDVAPQVAIETKILYNAGFDGDQCIMLIENKGGDTIPTSDIKIVTYYTSLTGSKAGTFKTETNPATSAAINWKNEAGTTLYGVVPLLADLSAGEPTSATPGNSAINFGQYKFAPGTIMSTYSTVGTGKVIFNQGTTSNAPSYLNKKSMNSPYTDFGVGSAVTVQIIHIPTNTVLYDKEVIVA